MTTDIQETQGGEAKRGGTAPGEQRVPKQPQGNSAQGGAGIEKYELSKIY